MFHIVSCCLTGQVQKENLFCIVDHLMWISDIFTASAFCIGKAVSVLTVRFFDGRMVQSDSEEHHFQQPTQNA